VYEGLERGARLPLRGVDVIVLIGGEVAAADPRPDRAGQRFDGDEARLQARLLLLQFLQKGAVGAQARKRRLLALPRGDGIAIGIGAGNELVEQIGAALPEVIEWLHPLGEPDIVS